LKINLIIFLLEKQDEEIPFTFYFNISAYSNWLFALSGIAGTGF